MSATAHPRPASRLLGYASLGMGVTLLAPGRASQLFGLGRRARLMAAIGARDLAIGIGLLSGRRPVFWLRVQALADVLDDAFVGMGLLKGTVERGLGMAWFIVAVLSCCLSLSAARRLSTERA